MTEQPKDGGAAFPTGLTPGHYSQEGMTLRDYAAISAMQSLITKAPFFHRDGEFGNPVDMVQFKADIAESAYCYADAMILAREATQ